MDRYKILETIARGAYGEVYKCYDFQDNSIVAMKLIRYESRDEGVPCSVIREISVLKELKHDNVVRLLNAFDKEEGFYLVFEYLDLDLSKFIQYTSKIELDLRVIKSFVFQILQGLSYCHSQKVLHRNLKPHNLLMDFDGKIIKLADFGLARTIDVPLPQYTTKISTLAYTAPELLLGIPYSSAVDIWSVGCIFAQMVKKQVLFGGTVYKSVMSHIISVFGFPDEKDGPEVASACLKLYGTEKLPYAAEPQGLAASVPKLDAQGLDLLSKMLCMNPQGRITAYDALKHPYFKDLHVNP